MTVYGRYRKNSLRKDFLPLLVAAASAHQLEDGEEDVDRVQVDGEGEGDGGLAVAAGADTGEVAYGEQGEDAEGEPE